MPLRLHLRIYCPPLATEKPTSSLPPRTASVGRSLVSLIFLIGLLNRSTFADDGLELFEKKIRPALVEHCYRCHSAEAKATGKLKGELQVDTRDGLRKGGELGPAVIPGEPKKSLLIAAIRHQDGLAMPPELRLPENVVKDFERWIEQGAQDPRDGAPRVEAKSIDWDAARRFWAFQRPQKYPVPSIKNAARSQRSLDFFLLAEMEKRGLKPARPASKRDFLRRATFDLTGLPPTPEELTAFENDNSPNAFQNLIDRLLASPRYGERWGRYWLDVARYADDKALAFVTPWPHAYRYRDWVVSAWNQDLPYDRFVHLQLAGDLTKEKPSDYTLQLAGLGFQGLGAFYHKGSVAEQVRADELDDRIDTLSRGLLGLTVACARCHDHKYDPIPTKDYYSLAAAYNGADWTEVALADPKDVAAFKEWEKQTKKLEAVLQSWLGAKGQEIARSIVPDLDRYLLAAWQLRVLQKKGIPHDVATIAEKEKLQPYFVSAYAKQLEAAAANKKIAVLTEWGKRSIETLSQAEPSGGVVPIPDILRQATLELVRQIQTALENMDRIQKAAKVAANPEEKKAIETETAQKLSPDHDALLKAVWLDEKSLFAIPTKEVPALLAADAKQEHQKRTAELTKQKSSGPPAPAMAHGVSGGGQAMAIHIRGNVERKGEVAPPGFLQVISEKSSTDEKARKFSRLELADAICSADNPLTARVIVNRVWQHHFGRGLVGTASNFGSVGERPSHPELLDTLAVQFMETGWSLKWLHRELMLSAAYQASSEQISENMRLDPGNRFLWRFSPRRLDVEAWRDAVLSVSGRLDLKMNGPAAGSADGAHVRRTIYGTVSRREPDKMMIAFDFPDANVSNERRDVTTVPQQQLFVLNSNFMIQSAQALAADLERTSSSDEQRVHAAIQRAYCRTATMDEVQSSLQFLRMAGPVSSEDRLTRWAQWAQAILASNEFAWID